MKLLLKLMIISKVLLIATLSALSIHGASAQSQALKSFTYGSSGCTTSPAALLKFDGAGNWKMVDGSTGTAPPGAGVFPTGNFYVRAVGVTVTSGGAGNWVTIGHSGSNGDWTSTAVLSGHELMFSFPSDAAPKFTAGAAEYFDAHVAACDGTIGALITFWWVPAS